MEEEGEKMEEEGEKMEEQGVMMEEQGEMMEEQGEMMEEEYEPFSSSSSSSSSSSFHGAEGFTRNFTIELMITAHGDMETITPHKYGAEEIKEFVSNINTCVFSFAPIGYSCLLETIEDKHYKKSISSQLKILNKPKIDSSTFGRMIVESEKPFGKYSEREGNDGINQRAHTVFCGKTHLEKNFDFFDSKYDIINMECGIFNLKTVSFSNGFTIFDKTNLLELDVFINFMREKHNKYIIKYHETDEKTGYNVLFNNEKETSILFSEILSFFEFLNRNNEIISLNILDLTCNEIFDDRTRRRVSKEAHKGRKQFGGKKDKKINFKYLPKSITKKNKRKRVNKLLKSRKLYKKGKYYTRKNVKSSRV